MTYAPDGHGPIIEAIARDVALLHERGHGKRPSSVKVIWRDDVITVLLQGVLTRGEMTLREGGRFTDVRRERQEFADDSASLLSTIVEGLTGRAVLDFMSQVSPNDQASEVFVLAAPGTAGRNHRGDGATPTSVGRPAAP